MQNLSHPLQFYAQLVNRSNINTLLEQLRSTEQLNEVLDQVTFQLGRIDDLMLELRRLSRKFTLRRSNDKASVEVEISNLEAHSKFFVVFELSEQYPFGPLPFSFRNLFGNVTAQEVEETIASVHEGYSRLTRVLQALKELKVVSN